MSLAQLIRDVQKLRRDFDMVRKVLLRQGTIDSVDTLLCTVVVKFPGEDARGTPLKSNPMPWLQRSTEHRPPAIGDHALVFDPSLGNGAAVVIAGWPSTLKPSPLPGADHVLYSGTATAKVISTDVQLGVAPTDFAALATRVLAELEAVKEDLDGFKETFDLHTHAGLFGGTASAAALTSPPSANVAGLPATAFPEPHTPESVAASQVKVQ